MGYQVNKLLQETCEEGRVYAELSVTGIHSVCTHKVYETLDKALANRTPTPTPIPDRPSEEPNKITKKRLPSVTVSSVIGHVHHLMSGSGMAGFNWVGPVWGLSGRPGLRQHVCHCLDE